MNSPESLKEYFDALKHVKSYHTEPIGFTDFVGTTKADNIYPKQNNVLLYLILTTIENQNKILEKLTDIENRIKTLEAAKTPQPSLEITQLTEQLGKLTLDKKPLIKSKEPYKFPKDEKTVFLRPK